MKKRKNRDYSIERKMPEDNYSPTGEILAVKGGAKSIVVLIHDDGYTSSVAAMDRRFDKYGLVGDAALLGMSNRPHEPLKHYMSNGRWKVINHSMTHKYWGDDATLTVDATKLANEVIRSGEMLREIFPNQRVITFAYPGISSLGNVFGYDRVYAEIRELVAEHYIAGRGFLDPSYVELDSITWDMTHCGVMRDSSVDNILSDLGSAGESQRFYVYLAHGVEDGPNHNITGENFELICKKVAGLVADGTVWNTHFEDACLYLREAECAKLTLEGSSNEIRATLTDTLDDEIYNYPLTVRIDLPDTYPAIKIVQGDTVSYAVARELNGRWIADIPLVPDRGVAVITKIAEEDISEPEENERTPEDTEGASPADARIDLNYFPGWTRKSVTFTMDDGIGEYDRHFLSIVRPAGILGTFNLYAVNLKDAERYRKLYEGYGIANHCNHHALFFNSNKNYNITNDPWPGGATADTSLVYKHPTVEGLYYYFVPGFSWHPLADLEHYLEFAMQTEREIEEIFGEGVVKGFVYPHGTPANSENRDKVVEFLKKNGYTNIRRTHPLVLDTTGFALPEDRYSWSYNANHTNLLTYMQKYEELGDDGELKMFAFGVHPQDFETNKKWEDLYVFAATYGYRPDDYFYGTVDDIFAYEDAVKNAVVENGEVINNSHLTEIFFKVGTKKVTLPPQSVYVIETGEVRRI